MKKTLVILLILSLSLFFLSCSDNKNDIDLSEKQDNIGEDSYLSVWAVYWDADHALNEIEYIKPMIKEISYFAAYFNKNNDIFIPENITRLHLSAKANLKDTGILHYLSIVNDKINHDGSSSLKDKELLYSLLTDEKTREKHISDLISLCLENGYDGLEIDYEGLKDDEFLWPSYLEFCHSLYQVLLAHGLNMRIILEPSAPIDKYKFPEGPTYVIMCYNLHGSHSGPGPKANREFLQMLAQKTKKLPGKVNFALATGGFDWDSKGNVNSLTEEVAMKLIQQYNITPRRDQESQCLVFKYKDSNNVKHEIWFADATTLNNWMNILQSENNSDFSLWRLGGNMKESLKGRP